jgi:transcriptional regulator with XRE-family HTH domain
MTNAPAPSPSRAVAAEIRAQMARHQMTQGQLARRLGMSPATLSRRLLGVFPFTVDDIYQLADIFGVAPSALLY